MNQGVAGFDGSGKGEGRKAPVMADLLAEVLPESIGHFEVDGDDTGVELGAGTALNLFASGIEGPRLPVGPVGREGGEGVGHGEYPCAEGDLFADQAPRVSAAVKVLLVAVDDLCCVMQEGDFAEH